MYWFEIQTHIFRHISHIIRDYKKIVDLCRVLCNYTINNYSQQQIIKHQSKNISSIFCILSEILAF